MGKEFLDLLGRDWEFENRFSNPEVAGIGRRGGLVAEISGGGFADGTFFAGWAGP